MKKLPFASRRGMRQRGSILLQASVVLLVCVIALAGTELGYLFFVKREMQKAADLAALAGAQTLALSGCTAGGAAATANATQNLQSIGFAPVITPTCGTWNAASTAPQHFVAGGSQPNALKVLIAGTGPTLLPFLKARTVATEAIAAGGQPLAALTVRSTLVSVDSTKSALLNSVFGGLLGGSVNLTALSWNGLVNTDINLLKYLDRLALNVGVSAGQYQQLLNTNVTAGDLIQAAIDALQAGAGTGTVVVDAVNGLVGLKAAIPPGAPLLKLADLLQLQTGTPASGMDLGLNVFKLAQGFVQLANSKNAAVADLTLLSLPGFGNVNAKIKVIEPPQLSAIGSPELAKADPNGANRIYVRTAQIRTLISVNIPGLSGVTNLLNNVLTLLSPVTTLLNNVLSLNLVNTLTCVLSCSQTQTRVVLVPDNPLKLDINLDVGHGDGKVTDYNCSSPASKSLTVAATTAVANLRVGQMTDAQRATVFSSAALPTVGPLPLLDVETSTRTCTLLLFCSDSPWTKYSRTGLKADTSVGASSGPLTYSNPPNLNAPPPQYQPLSTTNVVSSLSTTLSGLQLQTYRYDNTKTNSLGALIGLATQLVSMAVSQVQTLVTTLLSPLLDPLVNLLLNTLGIDLAKTEVGGAMTCGAVPNLVY